MTTLLLRACALLAPAWMAATAQAATVQVTVDVSKPWLSYAVVFELAPHAGLDRGAFVYGQFYEPGFYATPPGTLDGGLAQLRPNSTLAPAHTDLAHPFYADWWKDDGAGGVAPNKIIQDGFYMQDDALAGHEIVFTGFTVASSLVAPYSSGARAYVIDTYGPGYTFNAVQYTPLVAGQAFSVSLSVPAGHHVAYGIELVGPNARAADLPALGVVQVSAVPEPAAMLLFAVGAMGWLMRRRYR